MKKKSDVSICALFADLFK